MKDPKVSGGSIDPRSVSAFSVYKGLVPGLKVYEDTSESTAVSRRKKAKKRERKVADGGGLKKEEKKEIGIGHSSDSSSHKAQKPSKNERQGLSAATATNGLPTSSPIMPGTSDSGESDQKKKKRKRKKKSKKVVSTPTSSEHELSTTTEKSSVSLFEENNEYDEEDESPQPSKKSKKVAGSPVMVPNPFAVKSKIDMANGNSKQKSKPVKVSQVVPKQITSLSLSSLSSSSSGQNPAQTRKADKTKKRQKSPQNGTVLNDPTYTVESAAPPPDSKLTFDTRKRIEDSVEHGKSVLDWLIHPVTSSDFLKTYWEKKPLLIKRTREDSKDFYKCILTTQTLDTILRKNSLKYGVNLDITCYTNGVRETVSENLVGRVRPAVVWDYYSNGCSIRMLNPQSYFQKLWKINSALQEWFGSFVGANLYLTPPDSQGFAPHYDDIEAFVIQIEGKKQWKVYAPRENEKLARFSSKNFSEADDIGEPIIDVVLEEGDLLYFPRGFIHQAKTVDGEHSLHITISCQQLNTYGDLLKHHVNQALDKLLMNDVQFREGLPTDYLSFMGIVHENSRDKEVLKKREMFSKKIATLVKKIGEEPADHAADAMGKKFIWDSIPPFFNTKEKETCVMEDGEFMQNGKVFNRSEFGPETEVKLVRKNCIRLVVEDGLVRLYYSTENPMVYHEEDAQYLELGVELTPAMNYLIAQYPHYTKIEDLPINSNDIAKKIQLISDLWERGLIFTKDSLEACDDHADFMSDSESETGSNKDIQVPNGVIANGNAEDCDDVESINLSELSEERSDSSEEEGFIFEDDEDDEEDEDGEGESNDSDDDDNVSFTMNESISDDADDGQADIDQQMMNVFNFGEFNDEDDDGDYEEEIDYNDDEELDSDSEDEEDEEEDGEEEEIDEDEFDRMDKMEETDDDDSD